MLLNCGVGEDSCKSLEQQGAQTSQSKGNQSNIHWKDWCWSWNPNTLATWCKELTHLKSLWCWERVKVGGEGDNRGWDGWMALLTYGRVWAKLWELGDGQGSLVCCSPWGCKELDMTEWLNWTENTKYFYLFLIPFCTFSKLYFEFFLEYIFNANLITDLHT